MKEARFTSEDLNKRTPFTLPNGQAVLLRVLRRADYDSLNQWIRTEYLRGVSEAVNGLDPVSRQELLLAAISHAAQLSFQFGEGSNILLNSAYGLTRMIYQLIDNPPLTFEGFHKLMFPDEFINIDGLSCLTQMMTTAYAHIRVDDISEEDMATILETVLNEKAPVQKPTRPKRVSKTRIKKDKKKKTVQKKKRNDISSSTITKETKDEKTG